MYILEKRLSISIYLFFSFTSNFFFFLFLVSVPCFLADPLPSFNWWAVSVGGDELKWRQLTHNQLLSPQGPHFSPHSIAKPIIKA